MKVSHQPLLKEVYEKGKPVAQIPEKKLPPWMNKNKNATGDKTRQVKSEAAKRRLQAMSGKKPEK
jgi:hypothetical protein